MSKTSNPVPALMAVEIIDEPYFEKFADAALLLKCFEVVKDALDVINEPEYSIEKEDDTHVDLIRAYYALKVLFKRKTGADARAVSDHRWDVMRTALLSGEPAEVPAIPKLIPQTELLTPVHYDQFTDLTLACMSFNLADKGQTELLGADHRLSPEDFRRVVVPLSNSLTALRVLVIRMSGGTINDVSGILARMCRPEGETLQ